MIRTSLKVDLIEHKTKALTVLFCVEEDPGFIKVGSLYDNIYVSQYKILTFLSDLKQPKFIKSANHSDILANLAWYRSVHKVFDCYDDFVRKKTTAYNAWQRKV